MNANTDNLREKADRKRTDFIFLSNEELLVEFTRIASRIGKVFTEDTFIELLAIRGEILTRMGEDYDDIAAWNNVDSDE
jgi:type IV secretory pathway ATPase VirB11/archaellum biosynthesis ATPase